MKNILLTTTLAAVVLPLSIQAGASAQSLDYTAMSDLFGEPVTAGATGAPQRSSDVPATMVIITQDDIQRFPEADIPGILRHYAGINFNRYSFGDSQVSIRGAATGYTPRLLVLVNGREVYLDSYGYTAWSTLPVQLEEIQQIEVVKGAQSALYGFNAVAGVVNIITRNPQHGDYANVRVNAGTDGYSDASFVAARSFGDRASVRVSYGHGEADEFDPVAGNAYAVGLADGGYTRETAAIEGRFRVTDKITLTAEATLSDVQQQELTSIFYATRSAYELNSYKLDLEADTDYGFVTLSGYRNESEIAYDFGPLSSETTVFRAQDLFKVGANDTVRLSVELRSSDTVSFPEPGNGDMSSESWAAAAMWNHSFSNALDATFALRYDVVDWSRGGAPNPATYPFAQADYDVSFEEISYNAALVWQPDFGGSVRLMAGRGIQAPTSFDLGFTSTTTSPGFLVAVSGNPNMVASAVTNYELAYDRDLTDTVSLRAALFHVETEDVRGVFGSVPDLLPPAANVPTFLFDNRGETTTSGVELALSGDPEGHWDWDVSYTYQSVEDDLSPVPFYTVQDFEGVTPEHIANAHLGWTGERFTADAYINYVSSIVSPIQPVFGSVTQMAIDDQLSASFRAGYRLNDHVGVSVNAQNANFGDGEVVNVNYQPGARYWVQLTASF